MQRLITRAQFQVALGGSTVAKTAHFALHRAPLPVQPAQPDVAAVAAAAAAPVNASPVLRPLFSVQDAWLGAMVPKRWARRAVTRNAIKRQIYTVAAALEVQLPAAVHVVRLRSTFDRSHFKSASSDLLKQAVRAEITQLLSQTRAAGAAR